jgi:hypothetical protein
MTGWTSFGKPDGLPGGLAFIDVGRNADGRLEVFGTGANSPEVWNVWQTSPNNGWSAWGSLGQVDAISPGRSLLELAVGTNQDGRLEVFVNKDDNLSHIAQTFPGNGWGPWGTLSDGLALFLTGETYFLGGITLLGVASNLDGRLEVFIDSLLAGSNQRGIWHKAQSHPNNGWGGWNFLGGPDPNIFFTFDNASNRRTVTSNTDGRLEVFLIKATNPAGSLINGQSAWYWSQTSPNNGWSPMSDVILPDVANHVNPGQGIKAATDENGTMTCITIGQDGNVWAITITPHVQTDLNLGRPPQGGPPIYPLPSLLALTHNYSGGLEMFLVGTDGAIWHNWSTAPGIWSGWMSLGGEFPEDFAVGHNLDGRLEAFAIRGGELWHRWQLSAQDSESWSS